MKCAMQGKTFVRVIFVVYWKIVKNHKDAKKPNKITASRFITNRPKPTLCIQSNGMKDNEEEGNTE